MDQGENAPLRQIEGLDGIGKALQIIHDDCRSFEHRLAIRTALHLFTIAEKSQIQRSVRLFMHAEEYPIASRENGYAIRVA